MSALPFSIASLRCACGAADVVTVSPGRNDERLGDAGFLIARGVAGEAAAVVERVPAEVFHPSVFIQDELDARDWSTSYLAARMPGDFAVNVLAIDLYMLVGPHEPGLRIDPHHFGRAFGVSPAFFRNLEAAWLASLAPVPQPPEDARLADLFVEPERGK